MLSNKIEKKMEHEMEAGLDVQFATWGKQLHMCSVFIWGYFAGIKGLCKDEKIGFMGTGQLEQRGQERR